MAAQGHIKELVGGEMSLFDDPRYGRLDPNLKKKMRL